MKIVDTMPTLSTTPILRRPVRITPLVSSTKDGKPYARPAHVQAKISKILSLPRSCWVEEAENLENETLVFLIRRTHGVNDDICGGLMEELRKRIVARTRRFAQNLDDFDEEQLISNVEIKVLELLLTKEASREHDFLEIALQRRSRNWRSTISSNSRIPPWGTWRISSKQTRRVRRSSGPSNSFRMTSLNLRKLSSIWTTGFTAIDC
jgi:hypothetical protein